MLKPNKHTNPDLTVLNLSSYIIKRLKRTRVKTFEELRTAVINKDSRLEPLLIPSLQFLFLIGVLEYHPKNDVIEYLGSNETE